MDALDVKIVRAMGFSPYAGRESGTDALKAARIAKLVGVTPETVRERVARLEADGVIEGYDAMPNLRHLGLEASAYLFRPTDDQRRERLREAPKSVDGLLEVTFFLGSHACVDLSFGTPGERARRLRALSDMTGDPEPTSFFGWTMPPVKRALTPLDWRILQALRGRARRSLVEVAEEIGVGYRTVKRHHDRMAREGSFFVKPLLNPAKDPGLVPAGLLFFFGPGADASTASRISAAFDEELVLARAPESAAAGNFDVLVFARSVADVEGLRQRGARLPGVARVDALVLADVLPCGEWIDETIAQRVAGISAKGLSRSGGAGPAS